VLAIYAKSGGNAGKHSWVSDSSNIAAVSNIPVQLFDHILGVQFCTIPGGQTLHVKRFCLLPSTAFLCTLEVAPSQTESRLKISPQDGILFRNLKDSSAHLLKAVTSLAGRAKNILRVAENVDHLATSFKFPRPSIHMTLPHSTNNASHGTRLHLPHLVMFRPGLAQKPRLWLGFGFRESWAEPKPPLTAWPWPGLAQAAAFGTHSRQIPVSRSGGGRGHGGR
jgi:hypothetical protein